MRNFNSLTKLLNVQPGSSVPFLSVYLRTEPNHTGKKDFDVFLKKQLNDHLAVLNDGTPEHTSLKADAEKIKQFAESIDPSSRGVAIFACSGANEFFETFEFEVPFDDNQLFSFDRPFLYPLVRLIDQHPPFAVVAADTNAARIFVFKRGETIRREGIQNTKTNRTEVGGWSQMRYQRHIENFHQQHAKEVVAELDKIVQEARIDRVVLAGDESVIIPLLRAEMSDELASKVVDTLSLNVNTPEHEIGDASEKAVAEHKVKAEKETIDHLFEVNYEDGVGVTGFENVLSALFNGQVQELYLSSNPDDIVYRREEVKLLLKNYAPGLNDDLPEVSERESLIDELIKLAASSADRVRFIEDPHLLKTVGGVGAILRYQAKGVSN
jgi:peptide subunit release factor 1 (eRF1)